MKNCTLILLFSFLFINSVFSQTGTVRGYVYDDATGDPILFGNVLVAETDGGTTTDLDGAYTLDLPVGSYTFTFSYLGYADFTVSNVEVTDGEVNVIDVRIKEDSEVVDEIVIVAKQLRNTEVALATIKRNSPNFIAGVSASTIKKAGDSNAAAAVKRVAGVSVEDGKYVYVRGLGDRYTKSILNGMDIPGLDPDRNTIQMDLFPTNIIDNIIVLKSFTADLPADFTGGIVDINTKDFPEEANSSISLGLGYNPAMHFNSDYLTYQGGSTDYLGFDDGTRNSPIANDGDLVTRVDVFLNNDNQDTYTQNLNNFSSTLGGIRQSSLLDYNIGYTLGDQKNFNSGSSLGYTLNLSYKNSTDYYTDVVNQRWGRGNTSDITALDIRESQIGEYGTNNVLLSAMAGVSYKTQTSRFSLNALRIQNGESTAGLFDYVGSDQGSNFTATQHNLEYSQREITNLQLSGTTSLKEGKHKLNWRLSPTFSSITDPDIRFTRVRNDGDRLTIGTESGIPQRIWRFLDEVNLAGKVDYNIDYTLKEQKAKLKFGGGYITKNRQYSIETFSIFPGNSEITENVNDLFREENFFNAESNILGLFYNPDFVPFNVNEYDATINTANLFVSNEFEPIENLKVIAGLRAEHYNQFYTGVNQSGDRFNNELVLDDLDLFPSLNATYVLNDNSSIKGSFSQTIARPSFKEASFATIIDPLSGRTFIGGFFPDIDVETGEEIWDGQLRSTSIQNYDLRFETYRNRGQNISLSVFYKSFQNPIEIVQYVQAANNFQPRNVGDGRVAGVEVEFLKYLGAFESKLGGLAVRGNVTLTQSQIEMSETEFTSRVNNARDGEVISRTRDMSGQAPYIINGGFSYKTVSGQLEFGAFYNVRGRTLEFVGIADRPDVYTRPFHSLNLTGSYKFGVDDKYGLGFKVDNLLQSKRESVFESFGSEDQLFSSLTPGTNFSVSLSYKIR